MIDIFQPACGKFGPNVRRYDCSVVYLVAREDARMLSGRMCDSNEEIETATRIVSPVKSLRHEDETSCSSGLADQILRTDFFHEHTRYFVKHIETVNSGQDNVLIDDLFMCYTTSLFLLVFDQTHLGQSSLHFHVNKEVSFKKLL